jgi:hypothetical protein
MAIQGKEREGDQNRVGDIPKVEEDLREKGWKRV